MSTTKKQDNYRFSFLLKLSHHDQLPTADFAKIMAEVSGAVTMLFAQGEVAWLHLSIDPLGKPLSRKFFSETHKGSRVLTDAGLIATETPVA